MVKGVYFSIKTPQSVTIRTTKTYWLKIIREKHPSIKKYKKQVQEALKNPDEIRESKQDQRVHLYYKKIGKLHVCVVTDYLTADEGYIITAYLTDRIKEGEQIYVKT